MRDRLIELILECSTFTPECSELARLHAAYVAQHLLNEGVIVPPCKVGETVYSINRKALGGHFEDHRYIVDKWDELKVCEIPFSLTLWECGWENIFLTREEAERALERREG